MALQGLRVTPRDGEGRGHDDYPARGLFYDDDFRSIGVVQDGTDLDKIP